MFAESVAWVAFRPESVNLPAARKHIRRLSVMISTFRQTASGVIQGIRLYHRNHKYVVKVKVQHPGKPEENKNSKSRMASSQAVGRNASTQSEIFVSYGLLRRKGDSLDITIKKIRSMFVPQKNKQAPGRSWK